MDILLLLFSGQANAAGLAENRVDDTRSTRTAIVWSGCYYKNLTGQLLRDRRINLTGKKPASGADH